MHRVAEHADALALSDMACYRARADHRTLLTMYAILRARAAAGNDTCDANDAVTCASVQDPGTFTATIWRRHMSIAPVKCPES